MLRSQSGLFRAPQERSSKAFWTSTTMRAERPTAPSIDGRSPARSSRLAGKVEQPLGRVDRRVPLSAERTSADSRCRLPTRRKPTGIYRDFSSGASRTRTGDLLGAIQALFQLSYS